MIGARTVRRLALLLAFLLSGGVLLIPRLPVLFVLVALCLVCTHRRLAITRALLPVLGLLLAVFLLTVLRPGPVDLQSLAIRFANFLAALLLLNLYLQVGTQELARDLYAILKWMAIQALVTVVVAQSVPLAFLTVNMGEASFQTILLLLNYHVTIEDVSAVVRPDGFFYEPGVFQIYLNLYLYLALFVFRSWRQAILALLAVISTQSTTGILICGMQLVVFFLPLVRRGSLKLRLAAAFGGVILMVPVAYLAYQNVTDKLFGDFQGSSWARQYDLFTGLNVLAAHPWAGIGFDHDQYLKAATALGYSDTLLDERQTQDRASSNGVVLLLYSLGVPMSIPFFVGMFRQRFFANRALIGWLLLLSFMSESIILTPFFLLIIFGGLLARSSADARASRPAGDQEGRAHAAVL